MLKEWVLSRDLKVGFSIFGVFVAIIMQPFIAQLILGWIPASTGGFAVTHVSHHVSLLWYLEYMQDILSVLVIVMLVFLVNKSTGVIVPRSPWIIACIAVVFLYWLFWFGLHYAGFQSHYVSLALILLPQIAFFAAGMAKKVYVISFVSVLLVFLNHFAYIFIPTG